ncbi:hypothetical protein HOK021_67900 [Streptomyces hygroscopicus]|nr:hypothetical protein HOK021_67900 [Streptomyces hygroscopicus]
MHALLSVRPVTHRCVTPGAHLSARTGPVHPGVPSRYAPRGPGSPDRPTSPDSPNASASTSAR